jgi:hypothetical protein
MRIFQRVFKYLTLCILLSGMNKPGWARNTYLAVIFIAGTLALAGQLYFSIRDPSTPIAESLVHFFSFFTIITNIMATVCAATVLFGPGSQWGRFFSRASVFTAVTVYIIIVGLVYNLILRSTWQLAGIGSLLSDILHVAMPALFVLFWVIYVHKPDLKWNTLLWLIYPFFYGLYCVIFGFFTAYYPYSFMNVNALGYVHVFRNLFGLLGAFLVISLVLVGAAKLMSLSRNKKPA